MESTTPLPMASTNPIVGEGLAIESALQDLRKRLAEIDAGEQKERLRHEQEMAELAVRRNRYNTALAVLGELYHIGIHTDYNQPVTNEASVPNTEDSFELSAAPTRTEQGTLTKIITNISRDRDDFLMTDDYRNDAALKQFKDHRITEGLKLARRPGKGLIGISVFKGAKPMFINGLPEFFENDGATPKPRYAEKLRKRLAELGLKLASAK